MSQYVSATLRARVRTHFSGRCAYCLTDEALTTVTFEIEHIIPSSAGGPTEFENLCLACPACNRFKSSRTHAQVAGSMVRLFHPQLDVWLDHFDWTVDGTVIVALTDVATATIEALRMNRDQVIRVRELWVHIGRHPPE